MRALWAGAPASVGMVLERLNGRRGVGEQLAYTTVMTVLDNLHRKGWVQRELEGKAYRYEPVTSRAEAAANAVRELVNASGDPDGVLLHFARSASEHETELLRKALPKRSRKT